MDDNSLREKLGKMLADGLETDWQNRAYDSAEVLKVINIIDHPSEYAMINNNLGNALQYASTSHALANNIRAIEAYDEALRVRNPRDTPMEYANTIANKANVLRSLPEVQLKVHAVRVVGEKVEVRLEE